MPERSRRGHVVTERTVTAAKQKQDIEQSGQRHFLKHCRRDIRCQLQNSVDDVLRQLGEDRRLIC